MRAPPRGRAPLVPIAVAMVVMVVWGATPIATRIALDSMEPIVVACLRTILAGLLAIPLLLMPRQGPPRDGVTRTLLGISGMIGFVIFPVIFTVGQQRTSALHGVMILAALPIFTGAYASLAFRTPPRRAWLLGSAVALVGEVVLIGGRSASAAHSSLAGDLIVLAAALCVSAGYVAGAMLPPRGFSGKAASYWGAALGSVVLMPVFLGLVARDGMPSADPSAWGAVLFLALLTSIAGYAAWYWALDRGGIARIGTLQFTQPISGFVLAALILGESVTLPIAVGSALIVGGVVIAQRS